MRTRTGFALSVALALGACEEKRAQPPPAATVSPSPGPPPRATDAAPPRKQTFDDLAAQSRPLDPKPEPQTAGGRKLVAERCTIEGRQFLAKNPSELFKAIEVAGDRLLAVDQQGQVHGFSLDLAAGCTLRSDPGFGASGTLRLPEKTEHLSRDKAGRVFASNGIFSAWVLEDGKQQFECDIKGHVQVHPSGTWGIAPWMNANVRFVHVKQGDCHSEDWVLKELNDDSKREGPFAQVDSSAILGDLVLIGGPLAKSEDPSQPRVIVAYTRAGKERFRFGNPDAAASDAFSWVHAIEPCKPGVCVLDGDKRRLSLWTRSGKHLAAVDLSSLLGLEQPVVADFTIAGDGSAWFVSAAARDASVAEGLVYRVRGL
jgi:hypothetical protein